MLIFTVVFGVFAAIVVMQLYSISSAINELVELIADEMANSREEEVVDDSSPLSNL